MQSQFLIHIHIKIHDSPFHFIYLFSHSIIIQIDRMGESLSEGQEFILAPPPLTLLKSLSMKRFIPLLPLVQ